MLRPRNVLNEFWGRTEFPLEFGIAQTYALVEDYMKAWGFSRACTSAAVLHLFMIVNVETCIAFLMPANALLWRLRGYNHPPLVTISTAAALSFWAVYALAGGRRNSLS